MLDMIPAELHSTPQFLLCLIGGGFELHVKPSLSDCNLTYGIVYNSLTFLFQKQESNLLPHLG